MTLKRDWLLHQLGITQWTLRRPAVLAGAVAMILPPEIRLVLVADVPPPMGHPLIDDVMRSLGLGLHQSYQLTPEQIMMLPEETHCHCWWLGLEATRSLAGLCLSTPPLPELQTNAAAKRDLWQQMCRYEQDLSIEY